jgi:putative transposase
LQQFIEPAHTTLSIERQCELLGLSRSTYYYEPNGESVQNLAIMRALDELHMQYPFMGYRRLKQHLPDNLDSVHLPVNEKKIRRLMVKMGLKTIYPKPNLSKPNQEHEKYPYLLKGLKIEKPMHVWSTDITYIPMQKGFMYLCAIMDWNSRFITHWQLSNNLSTQFCKDTLLESIRLYGCPQIFNSDQGVQFTSKQFTEILKEHHIAISMDGVGRAIDNIFIERFWRTIKYEDIYLKVYNDGKELFEGVSQFIQFYNYRRRHQALNYQTPAQLFLK